MNKMLNFLNRTLYNGTEKVSSKATPSLEHFKTNVEQVDNKILQPFSTKFKTILKECYSNEEWVEEQTFVEEPIDLGEAARGLTERGIMRGDWGRLAHSTIKEAEGMMRTYNGRLNEDMAADEINEVIQDMPYNFTAGSANVNRLEENDSIFVEADTTVVEPLSKETLPKVAELTNRLVEVYNRITDEFTETGIAKVEQVEQPAVLVALSEIISSFNKLIDLSCGAIPVEETVVVTDDPLPAVVTGPTTEPVDGKVPPVDAVNTSSFSNENLVESIKKFFNLSNKDGAPMIWRSGNSPRRLKDELADNFGNPRWLEKQTYLTGPISNKGISDVLEVNGKVDIATAIKATDRYLALLKKQHSEITNYTNSTKPALDLLIKHSKKLNRDVYDEVKNIVDKVQKTHRLTVKWPSEPMTGKGTYSSPKVVVAKYQPSNVEIQALTEEQTIESMKLVMASLDAVAKLSFSIPDLPDDIERLIYTTENEPKDIGGVPYWDWSELVFSCISPPDFDEEASVNMARQSNSYTDIITACARWVDRSIKGKMQVSNEGLIDTIKSIFNSGPEINLDKKKKAIATLKNTYGDAKWVAEAKLKTGEVKVSNYDTFASNDPKAAKANITNAVAKADRHNQKVLDENSKMLAPVVNLFKGNDWQDPKKVATLLTEWKPNVKTNFQEPKWPDNAGAKIKLLDATGIVEAANVIIDVLSNNTKTIADTWLAQYPDLSVNGDIYKHKLSTIKDKDALEDIYLLAKRVDDTILGIHASYDDAKVESTYRVFAIDMLKLMQASISSFPSGSSVEDF